MFTNWYDHFLFALMGIIIPALSFYSKLVVKDDDEDYILPAKNHMYLNNFFFLLIGMLICLTAWNAGKNDWNLLGFRLPLINQVVITAMAVLATIYMIDGLVQIKYFRHDSESEKMLKKILPSNWKEYFSFLPLAIVAGVSEEVIYRAYFYHYLNSFYPDYIWGPYITILITSFGFSLAHLYQGWTSVFKIFIISLLFGVIYIYSKSLVLVILIHVLIDVVSGMSWLVFPEKNQDDNMSSM